MNIFNSTLIGSLLLTGLVINFSKVEYISQELHQSDLAEQQLVAQGANSSNGCTSGGQSPVPGCGRTEHWSFHKG